jgi:hypothetical protein
VYQPDDLLCPREASRIVGASQNALKGAASRSGIGYRLRSGRLVAVKYGDLERIRLHLRRQAGNPNWIAMRGKSSRPAVV